MAPLDLWVDLTGFGDEVEEEFFRNDVDAQRLRGRVSEADAVVVDDSTILDRLLPDGLRRTNDGNNTAPPVVLLWDRSVQQLRRDGRPVGVTVDASTTEGLERAIAAVGSTEWILAHHDGDDGDDDDGETEWRMIPAENVVGAAQGTGTRVAFRSSRAGDAAGLANALESGVDALCVSARDDDGAWEAARAERREREVASPSSSVTARPAVVVRGRAQRGDRAAVRADRVCLDLVRLLSPTEGCWIGSSARAAALVLSEASISSLVPSRPFRINAGPVHSYVLLGDGRTRKYLCELVPGEDEVAVYDATTGETRSVAVGRLKTEVRPCVRVDLSCRLEGGEGEDGDVLAVEGQIFLQQAETVRLGRSGGGHLRVTDLSPTTREGASETFDGDGEEILLRIDGSGTHIGKSYSGKVIER